MRVHSYLYAWRASIPTFKRRTITWFGYIGEMSLIFVLSIRDVNYDSPILYNHNSYSETLCTHNLSTLCKDTSEENK